MGVQGGAFDDFWLGYTETWGAADLREAIAATFGSRDADDVLCFAGASEGIFAANTVLVLPSTIYSSDLGATPTDRFRVGAGRRGLELGLAAMGAHLDATIRTS